MATRKPTRAKTKIQPKPPKPFLRLDADRQEEIVSIGVIILALLTLLGALNLSGGVFLSAWVQLLQALHQLVELEIGNLRVVEHVVAVLVIANLFAKLGDFLLDVFGQCFPHRPASTAESIW